MKLNVFEVVLPEGLEGRQKLFQVLSRFLNLPDSKCQLRNVDVIQYVSKPSGFADFVLYIDRIELSDVEVLSQKPEGENGLHLKFTYKEERYESEEPQFYQQVEPQTILIGYYEHVAEVVRNFLLIQAQSM